MSLVTLTSDFGYVDLFVGRFKGYLISHNRDIQIVDISHGIPEFNIITGGYSLKYTYESFPKNTIHIIRVYEQGLSNEGLIVASYRDYIFIAPDNGVLPICTNNQFDWIRKVNLDLIDSIIADEIYALVLQSVIDNTIFNISESTTEYKSVSNWEIAKYDNEVRGIVTLVDKFGNISTNIHIDDIKDYFSRFTSCKIEYRSKRSIYRIVENYNDVIEGDPMCRVNDMGYLEIAINKGSASKLLGIKFGQIVNIIFS